MAKWLLEPTYGESRKRGSEGARTWRQVPATRQPSKKGYYMNTIDESDINENYSNIIHIVESAHVNDVNGMLNNGAILLNISKNPPDAEFAFIYCVGWPSSQGDIPEWIRNYG